MKERHEHEPLSIIGVRKYCKSPMRLSCDKHRYRKSFRNIGEARTQGVKIVTLPKNNL